MLKKNAKIHSVLRRIFDFYIFENLHVSLAAFCMCQITFLYWGAQKTEVSFFIGALTFITYSFIKKLGFLSNTNFVNDKFLLSKLKVNLFLLGLGLIYVLFRGLLYIPIFPFFVLIPFIIITFFYAVPFFKTRKAWRNLRSIGEIKIFIIALSWSGATVLFPVAYIGIDDFFTWKVFCIFLQRFLFVFAITIPFDIRDLNSDSLKLKTIPRIIGIQKSKLIGYFAIIIFVSLEYVLEKHVNVFVYSSSIIGVVNVFFLIKLKAESSKYFCSFWIECLPIIWYILILSLIKF